MLTRLLPLVLLAGCAGGLYDFPTDDGTSAACREVVAAVPDQVGGQQRTPVDAERVAAWGDPRIVLRCGVREPSDLQPTSRCDDVDGVGWFTERGDDTDLFTTVGRDPDVSVEVPRDYEPTGAALSDLADVVTDTTRSVRPCV